MRKFNIVKDNLRKTTSKITLPTRATSQSAGYDFYSPIKAVINPHTSQMIWTDVNVSLNLNEVLLLNIRSSMGAHNVMLTSVIGIIDADYINADNNGNIGVKLYNYGDKDFTVSIGDRVAQGVIVEYKTTDDEAKVENKRTGGFGSTN